MDPSRANQSMGDSSSNYGDSIFSSRSPSSSNTSTIPPRGDEIDQWQRHIGMQDFAKNLQTAVDTVFPNHHKRSRYSNVYVLIFKWKTEDPKLPVWYEIEELCYVLDQIYGYEIEIFEIPDHKSHAKVVEKITAFIAINDDSKDDLKIVYYAGHSRLSDTRNLLWSSSTCQKGPTVIYTGIQHSLEQAESDVLILLDSCSSGIGDGGEGNGVTELMSACAFDTIANGVGHYSFTSALTTELRLLSKRGSFPVVDLYTKVYCRAQHHMLRGIKNERYPAPIHLLLTRDDLFPRCIWLSVQERASVQNQGQGPGFLKDRTSITEQGTGKAGEARDVDPLCTKRPSLSSEEGLLKETTDSAPEPPETSQSAVRHLQEELGVQSTLIAEPNKTMKDNGPVPSILQPTVSHCSDAPRLLFSVRLQEDIKPEDLSVEYFVDWLRIIPVIAEQVTVEAVFRSDSTLLLLALPFSLWPYMSPHPAVVNLGPIRSPNILIREPLNPWSAVTDWGVDLFPVAHLDNEMASPGLATMNDYDFESPQGGKHHPGFNYRTPTTENVSSSANFQATSGPSSKGHFDFDLDTMDDDNESDLGSEMPSTCSEMSSDYQESVFDAASHHSRSHSRPHSMSSSGRQGPLYHSALAGMKAIKRIGPCWRCRVLRKACDIQDPCSVCPRTATPSSWAAIGCRRGSLLSQMPPIELCPVIRLKGVSQHEIEIRGDINSIPENEFLEERIGKAKALLTRSYMAWMQTNCGQIPDVQPQLLNLGLNSPPPNPKMARVESSDPVPVSEYLLEIIWEVMASPSIKSILLQEHLIDSIDDQVRLLLHAAQYQASLETDQLISRSIDCLRSALQALAVKMHFTEISHRSCNVTTCSINGIRILDNSIALYLEELSQVFFKKENLRSKERWWLSVWYSLCIQSMVRSTLMELVKSQTHDPREHTAITEYLYLPVQLFIALTGSYDPLLKVATSGRSSERDEVQASVSAREAVGQESWHERGIRGSNDYLRRLFGLKLWSRASRTPFKNRLPDGLYRVGDRAWLSIEGESGSFLVIIDSDKTWDDEEEQWKYRVRLSDGMLYENGKLVGEHDLVRAQGWGG